MVGHVDVTPQTPQLRQVEARAGGAGGIDAHAGDVQIGEIERFEQFDHPAEGRFRVGIAQVVEGLQGREPYTDPMTTSHRAHGILNLQQEAGAVVYAAAVGVGTVVAAVAQELVEQIAVGGVHFHPVEARRQGVLGSEAILLDDAG